MVEKRYEVVELRGGVIVLKYSCGYTKVECNESSGKTIIINISGITHIPAQFDTIFGLGEYKKFESKIIQHFKEPNPGNSHCIKHTMVAKYLPKQAIKDIKAEKKKTDKPDLISKFFKET